MKKQLIAVVAGVALAGTPGLAQSRARQAGSPQTRSPQTSTARPGPAQGIEASQTETVTGCVEADADGRTYTLTDPSDPSKTLTLVADAGVDLSDHAGHKVEATGRLDRMESDQQPDDREPDTTASASDEHPKFHVSRVRMISRTCE